ncbi:hypothetical protein ACOSQ2_002157 [Xanthoceras sorbifolium]
MGMESGSLELKVMFCKDLKAFNFFQKLSVYAQVSIASDDPEKKLKQKQQQRTPADKEGDGNPEWKHEMRFDLKEIPFHDCDHIFLHFQLKHEGAMFGDKTIGEVHVPFKDLILESNGVVRYVNYEVSNTEGKSNGVLNFSYKVNGNGTVIETNSPRINVTGYPIAHHHHDQGSGIQYPQLDVHSSQPEVHYPVLNSPHGVVYPPLELQNSQQETVSSPQAVQYSSPRWQHPHQESYYPQPDATTYYPQPPPPPPPVYSYPPRPPPPMAHGAFYHHHHPSQFNPWQPGPPHMGFHSYSMPGTWGPPDPAAANLHPYENQDTSPNGFGAGRDHRSSSWNGR